MTGENLRQEKPKRIIFLDLLRAFAVLMMIQGHTIHTLLGDEYRTFDSPLYSFWHMCRGFTAPIFMFTAGAVFAYLFLANGLPWKDNPRVKKGIIRFASLLSIGYLLRYPTYRIFDFSYVSDKQMLMFYAVDALHLIAFGLLALIGIFWVAEKLDIKAHYIFLLLGVVVFFLYPFSKFVDWKNIFPLPIAAYFTRDTGSIFPLMPWIGYVLSGGMLGSYLVSHPKIYKEYKFIVSVLLLGVVFYSGAILLDWIGYSYFLDSINITTSWVINIQRLGVVLGITSLMLIIAKRLDNIPNIIKIIGGHSLLIYVVHLVILYGSAWVPGLYRFFRGSFSVWATMGSVALMYGTMIMLVLLIEKMKFARKKYLAARA